MKDLVVFSIKLIVNYISATEGNIVEDISDIVSLPLGSGNSRELPQ